MKLNVTQDRALRWAAQGLTVLLIVVAAVAVLLYMKTDELEATLVQLRADSDSASKAAVVARAKLQNEVKAASAKSAELEQKMIEAEAMKILLGKVEPQLTTILEAAGNAKAGKPEARAAALAGLGLIGQITHGAGNAAALTLLDRALVMDKSNCVAGLAVNLGGVRKVEVAPDCQALLPVAGPAGEAKPASTAPAAAPAGDAGKAAKTPG